MKKIMMSAVALLLAAAAAAPAQQSAVAAVGPTAAQRYAAAASYSHFVLADTARHVEWTRNYEQAATTVAGLAPRVRAVRGHWHLLVVAEPWCNDALNSVPYLARLAELNPAIEIRLLRKSEAPELLAAHPFEGRDATPLVLLLDDHFVERGAWIERPVPLRELIKSKEGRVCEDTLKEAVREWRSADAGRTVVDEVLAMVERAASATTAASTTLQR